MTMHEDRTPNEPGQPPIYWPPQQTASTQGMWEQASRPAPKKSRLWLILAVVGALFVILAAAIGITVAAQTGSDKTAGTATQAGYSAEDQQRQLDATPAEEPTTEPAGPTISASDMTLTLKTTEKQCFGFAGCNVTVEIRAKRNAGVPEPNPDDTWLVTYQITGDESGPIIGSFEITGGNYQINEESLSTKSSKTKVTVKVVSVEKVGI